MLEWWSNYIESLRVSTDAIGIDEKQRGNR